MADELGNGSPPEGSADDSGAGATGRGEDPQMVAYRAANSLHMIGGPPGEPSASYCALVDAIKAIMRRDGVDNVSTQSVKAELEESNSDLLCAQQVVGRLSDAALTAYGQLDEADEIFEDFLFLGQKWNAGDRQALARRQITHVVNAAVELPNCFPAELTYHNCRVHDVTEADLRSLFPQVIGFIERVRSDGQRLLVHCSAGVSRSACLVVAYAMKRQAWPLDYALAFVKGKRARVKPNEGFLQQLGDFERALEVELGPLRAPAGQARDAAGEQPDSGPDESEGAAPQ